MIPDSTHIPAEDSHDGTVSLTQLPTEIRQAILEEVILSRPVPARNPSESQAERFNMLTHRGVWILDRRGSSAPSLLLVNKQINEETKVVTARTPVRCYVDLMFVKSCGLWPSWYFSQQLATEYIDSVEATIRLFEPMEDLDPCFSGSMSLVGGAGGPPGAVWDFYKMLAALFIEPGFSFLEDWFSLENFEPNYVVRKLVIDVLPPTDGYPHRSVTFTEAELDSDAGYWAEGRYGANDASKPAELRLADFLLGHFDCLWDVGRGTEYWAIFCECVTDRIVFRVNGNDYRVYNIDRVIEMCMRDDFIDIDPVRKQTRLDNLAVWKAWLDKRRSKMKLGLPLGDNPRPVTNCISAGFGSPTRRGITEGNN
ncbi:unnamed protein product [Clonostachys rhizophaga]|uniref:Uncharacterized protein n=1 Tax=Clonostachys rhizophaga TaxID=160324 RepID=A0A9N9VJL1_9HYPO|nr:unnamed protein product [Clonostachys rhizophaga]